MKPIAVLGMGNRLMMDDGIGVYVVEELNKHNQDEMIRYAAGETDFNYCLDVAYEASELIIVDAAEFGKGPGEITVLPLSEIQSMDLGLSAHNLHFFHYLHDLQLNLQGALIGIEPYQIDIQLGLSAVLREQFPCIVRNVKREVEKIKFHQDLS